MKARIDIAGFRDALRKTTLPQALTDQKSATVQSPARFEFVNHIVEILELDGGLVAREAPVPAYTNRVFEF